MEELIKRLERVIQTGVPDKDGMHPIAAEVMLEVVKSQLSTNLAEVGTDAVSRKAVKELAYSQIRSMYCGVALKEQRETMLRIADNVIGLLAPVTSAQPATNCSEIPNNSDTISRQAVLNEFCHSCDGWSCNPNTCCKTEWIRKLPVIQPGRKECEEREQGECPWYAG